MKLLLAIDSSVSSELVVDTVATRPWPADTTARVLSVLDTRALASATVDVEPLLATEAEGVTQLVKAKADRLTGAGIPATPVVIEGYPKTRIVEYAEEWEPDFILIGSHGHGALTRFLLGSTARSVTRHAPCSVEIVRAVTSRAGMRVLLATDGSECSLEAARSIAARPWPKATEVKVVSAVEMFVPVVEPWHGGEELLRRLEERSREIAGDAISEALQIVKAAGLRTCDEALIGDPKARIVDEAKEWEADLVVVGSHGRRGIERVLQGSVSEAVAMHAPCSVEVIRAKARPTA